MQAFTASDLYGVWATALLPVTDTETIDFERLESALDVLLDSGVHGLYTNGSAGEFHTLTEMEYDRLHELFAARCRDAGMPFQLGASHPSGQLSLARIRRATTFRPGAIQVILPDWLPLRPDEVIAAVARMADAADGVPLVLYNPPCAKTRLDPELFGRLAEAVPTLIGVKVPGGDAAWFARMRDGAARRLAIFVAGHTLAAKLPLGASGSYSNVACLSPAGAVRWYQRMLADPQSALDTQKRLLTFFDEHIAPLGARGYSDPALDKTLAAIGDWAPIGTRVRWPYASVPAELVPGLRDAAHRAVPELFSGATIASGA
ncbi:dihydrodipicolinate synthase family protein [Stackebrandtia nassauensis]|uniref:Dihydrodipicolinate synthetase n=1 Tax=Stackebrandtia nassauensis (strain DSM 44728 / CIP 108903 / NRRL B-16338 / NBRC 102104 / LLR-40K-21) TaxID=446470 RepID=D3Q1E5_STANL|nr:dihydrodipicolinate synthase family protein [Stackebrandtia nassauensis]ADD45725.1 dihydrodipicolinate synthetase [Stackebrandtia nassauensis DSM 44728]